MQTGVEIDDRFLADAMATVGHTAKRATVGAVLCAVVRPRDQVAASSA